MKNRRKGIILAGGNGTRMFPMTLAVSKQLLPVYDKPTIYYPLNVLRLAGIKDILIITKKNDQDLFKNLLGNGNQWQLNLSYKIQPSPNGIAQAFVLAEDFLDGAPSALILGDNIFYGKNFKSILVDVSLKECHAMTFVKAVDQPENYGVVTFSKDGSVYSIEEKPKTPASKYALTGLYFLDQTAPARAKILCPSKRGEYEITDLLESYLANDQLRTTILEHEDKWFDTGTPDSLLNAANFVKRMKFEYNIDVGALDNS